MKGNYMNRVALYLTSSLAIVLAACGGPHEEHGGHHEGPEDEACDHMIDGPGLAATAIADMTADAPDTGEHSVRWDVALAAGAGGMHSGYVDLVVEEAGITDLYLDVDVPVKVWNASGGEVTVHHAQTTFTQCTEVSVGLGYQLGVGTYLVGFGPTTEEAVSMVVVLEGEHAD
ncbi:MAG TPA: hypothetical protein VNM90_30155 [Haliangium sp.]|nr:hypothetical protein [Haliangium sp.]